MGSRESRKTTPRAELRGNEAVASRLADPVVIGFVTAPHGVRGTLKVKAPGSGRHLREGIEPFVNGERRRIILVRETPKGFLVDLEGVTDREEAARLRGSELLLDRDELDAPEEGEFYVGDLVGLTVYDAEGARIGTVIELFETPAHEILVVWDGSATEHYIPFTLEHVPTVDLEEGYVVVSLPVPE